MKRSFLLVSVILIFCFGLRVIDIGAAPFQGDEAWWGFLGFSWGHDGVRSDVGIVSSTGIRLAPLSSDIFAIPFAFNPDPRLARLFLAVIHLISMAVLYQLVRRYWSTKIALVTLLLYGVMPNAVWSSRYLWNVYLAAPLMIGYYLTGFLLIDGKRWASWLHPLLLALAVQAHPSVIVYGVLTLIFYALQWQRIPQKKRLIFDHALGVALAGISMLPWIIGLSHQPQGNSADALPRLRENTAVEIIGQQVVEIPTRLEFEAFGLPASEYTPPADHMMLLLKAIGWFTVLGSLYLIGRGMMQRQPSSEALIGAAYLILPVMLIFLPTPSYAAYLSIMLPAGAIVQALILVGEMPFRPLWLGGALVGLLCAVQIGVLLDGYQQIHNFKNFSRESMLGLNEMIDLAQAADQADNEIIYLVEGSGAEEFEQAMVWQILSANQQARVIWGDQMALPVPDEGVTYVGYADAFHVPELYYGNIARLTAGNLYRVVDLPPHSVFPITCPANSPQRLDNGATILGYYATSPPVPNQEWVFYLLWQGSADPPNNNTYQIFNHLIDSGEARYAQSDIASLPPNLWRDGETLISRVTLLPGENLPDNESLFLRVGMYTLPTIANANVIDDQGNAVGQWVIIPVCST